MNLDCAIDDRDRKRSFDDAFDDGSPPPDPGASSAAFTAPSETPTFPPAPADPLPGAPSLGEEVAVTSESLILLMNPLAGSVIAENMQTGHFHRMDERASKIAAIWNALTGNQNSDGSVRIPLSQTIVDGLAVTQHAIEFVTIAVRRDLAGDGYHDQTGLRLWTQPPHDALYSYPSLGSKTELIVHLAHIVNLKASLKQQVDDGSLITASYEDKLDYLVGVKHQFDSNVQLAEETYDNNRTRVNLDYYNAHTEYHNYLLAATNHHIGTRSSWRPTAMPDIITTPPGFGGASYTRSLERMVHYNLGMPQFFDSEQLLSSSWRLVRQLPAGSTTWHPENDNLEGVDTVYGDLSNYGVIDRSDWTWSVPFNPLRPAHTGQQGYSISVIDKPPDDR